MLLIGLYLLGYILLRILLHELTHYGNRTIDSAKRSENKNDTIDKHYLPF